MALLKVKEKISVEDYLEGEKFSAVKYEYIDGEVYSMAGTSTRHNRIAGNFFSRLTSHLEGSECETYFSDLKVRVSPVVFYYPDVAVTCDATKDTDYVLNNPCLIIEVLSPSTRRIDRTEKLFFYRNLPSMQEYVMVEQDAVYIEIHRRISGDDWEIESFNQMDEQVNLTSIGLSLNVRDIYRNVRFEETITE